MSDANRYADLRGRLDAAERVLSLLLPHVNFAEGKEGELKAEILQWSTGLREEAKDNPLTLAQADAMARYAACLRSD